jgi:hypothetical protein
MNSSIERMTGGTKAAPRLAAMHFLKKWAGLFPGKTTRFPE